MHPEKGFKLLIVPQVPTYPILGIIEKPTIFHKGFERVAYLKLVWVLWVGFALEDNPWFGDRTERLND